MVVAEDATWVGVVGLGIVIEEIVSAAKGSICSCAEAIATQTSASVVCCVVVTLIKNISLGCSISCCVVSLGLGKDISLSVVSLRECISCCISLRKSISCGVIVSLGKSISCGISLGKGISCGISLSCIILIEEIGICICIVVIEGITLGIIGVITCCWSGIIVLIEESSLRVILGGGSCIIASREHIVGRRVIVGLACGIADGVVGIVVHWRFGKYVVSCRGISVGSWYASWLVGIGLGGVLVDASDGSSLIGLVGVLREVGEAFIGSEGTVVGLIRSCLISGGVVVGRLPKGIGHWCLTILRGYVWFI